MHIPMSQAKPTPETIKQFTPHGKMRVGINLGNPLLANLDKSTNKPIGISVDLANELAKRLGVELTFTTYMKAGDTVDAVKRGDVDLVFVAIDPVRGEDVSYSPAYVQIEGAYLVRENSPLKSNDEVDQPGTTVVVGKGSAYDLFLTREIKQATLIRAATSQAVVDDFMSQSYDVAAGVRQQLESDALRYNGVRMLPGRFMVINQAMGVPKGRPLANAHIADFVAEMKSSGFVANSLKTHKVDGAKVAE